MNIGDPVIHGFESGRPVSGLPQAEPDVRGGVQLGEGDKVMAEVTEARPDGKLTFRLQSGQLFLAEMATERTLVPGQRVMLSVTEVRGGVPMVEIAGEGAASAETFLKAMKAPISEQNMALAREAILQQAQFTPGQFSALSKAFGALSEPAPARQNAAPAPARRDAAPETRWPEQAVFMAKHSIPITRETVAQYRAVTQPQAQLGALLQKLLDILPPAPPRAEQPAPPPQTPQEQPVQPQPPQQPAEQVIQQQAQPPQQTAQPVQPAPAAPQPAEPVLQQQAQPPQQPTQTAQPMQPTPAAPQQAEPVLQQQAQPTPQETAQPVQPSPPSPQPAEPVLQQQAQPPQQAAQPVQSAPAAPQPAEPVLQQQAQPPQLPRQPELPQPAQTAQTPAPPLRELLEALFAKISPERGRELPRELDAPRQTREIGRLLTSLVETAREMPEQARSELLSTARDIAQTLRFAEQINHCAAFVQLPLTVNGEKTTAQLYVFNDSERGKKIDPQNATLFLSLTTSNLGTVEGFVKVIGSGVEADFSLKSETAAKHFRAGLPELSALLEARGYRLERVSAAVKEEALPPAAVEKGRAGMAGRYRFNRAI